MGRTRERERERERGETTTADPRAGLPEEPIAMHKSIHRLRKDTSGKCCLPYHKRNGRLSYAAAKYGHFAVSKALAGATSSRVCTCRGCQLRVAASAKETGPCSCCNNCPKAQQRDVLAFASPGGPGQEVNTTVVKEAEVVTSRVSGGGAGAFHKPSEKNSFVLAHIPFYRGIKNVQVREREPRAEEVPAPLHLPPAVHPVPDRGVGGGRTNIFCFFWNPRERESTTILFFFLRVCNNEEIHSA